MDEQWQLYDEKGQPIANRGATKNSVFKNGLLHGAAHVWIWRKSEPNKIDVLLQRRSANKRTWPNLLDISAAGHIDLGEDPITAAIRETREEIGLLIKESQLELIDKLRARMVAPDGSIENEFRWLYSLELQSHRSFIMAPDEVSSLIWQPFNTFKQGLLNNKLDEQYVPHPDPYFERLIAFFEKFLTLTKP